MSHLMHRRSFTVGILATAVAMAAAGAADTAKPGEKAKIEALIRHVEGLQGASFIRNGKSYSSENAGKFLRGKWQSKEKEIVTAADFIAKVASVSSTSGQPYLIRFADGREVKCGDYLTSRLKAQP